jgi:hypothetical protein
MYPLIVVPCLLLGRVLSADDGSSIPDWLESIWRRVNSVLLVIVSLGVAGMPFFALGNRWTPLWTCMAVLLAAAIWFSRMVRTRSPSVPSSRSGRLATQAVISGAIAAIAMMVFATLVMPRIDSANEHRPRELARAIHAALPPGAQLWVLEDSYRPFWYYLEPDVQYFHGPADLPARAHYILLPDSQTKVFLQSPSWQNTPPVLILQIVDNERRAFDLFARDAKSS